MWSLWAPPKVISLTELSSYLWTTRPLNVTMCFILKSFSLVRHLIHETKLYKEPNDLKIVRFSKDYYFILSEQQLCGFLSAQLWAHNSIICNSQKVRVCENGIRRVRGGAISFSVFCCCLQCKFKKREEGRKRLAKFQLLFHSTKKNEMNKESEGGNS